MLLDTTFFSKICAMLEMERSGREVVPINSYNEYNLYV